MRRISWGETQKWVSLYENSKTREEKLRNGFLLTRIPKPVRRNSETSFSSRKLQISEKRKKIIFFCFLASRWNGFSENNIK